MESYIIDKKKLYTIVHDFMENSNEAENLFFFEELTKIINFQEIEENHDEMQDFLQIIKSISNNHHRDPNFLTKIKQILDYYKNQIKRTLSNIEIFNIFESNKLIILYLLQNDIITISEPIYKEIINKFESNGNSYCYFFYLEIENFIGEKTMKYVKSELISKFPNIFENFEEKRKKGENDSYICLLIRQDSVVEFIKYLNQKNCSPSSRIIPSIFETNPFLIDHNNVTLIEYSAFFGSIQIFKYLMMNKAEITPSIWLYAIHSQNAELIHLLESLNVLPKESQYIRCFIESIKCHHNDIAFYIEENLLQPYKKEIKEEIVSSCIQYHNYDHFNIEIINDYGFFYLYFYNYKKLFELLSNKKEQENKAIISIGILILITTFKIQSNFNDIFHL